MKSGKTITELAAELERQANAKRDFIAATKTISMTDDLKLQIGDEMQLPVRDLAHRQIGEHTKIPAAYYDKMRNEAPALLASNVKTWFDKYPVPRMLRTLDDNVRAFLSDRYRPLENFDLAEAALPQLVDLNVEIISCEITETRMYIKAVDKRINRDIPVKGKRMGDGSHVIFDTCSPAIVISNSEVGLGALSIETGVWTKACTNLAIFRSRSMKKYHVGGKHAEIEGLYHLLSDKTKRVTDAAVWMQVRDVVKAAFEEALFSAEIDKMTAMTEQPIAGDVEKVVELTQKRFGLQDGERKSILRHLIQGGDLTRYGLFNAITRTAEDLDNYDRATEFEKLGGTLIELPKNEWKALAEAA